jgi:hypothetical protein
MPYEVTSIRDNFKHIAVVPRRQLAYTIVKNLAALKLNLNDFQQIVTSSHLNPMMIVSESDFKKMVHQQAGLDMIYGCILLNDNTRIYYHTNWTVDQNSWQLMAEVLQNHDIYIKTIMGKDNSFTYKTKEPI